MVDWAQNWAQSLNVINIRWLKRIHSMVINVLKTCRLQLFHHLQEWPNCESCMHTPQCLFLRFIVHPHFGHSDYYVRSKNTLSSYKCAELSTFLPPYDLRSAEVSAYSLKSVILIITVVPVLFPHNTTQKWCNSQCKLLHPPQTHSCPPIITAQMK